MEHGVFSYGTLRQADVQQALYGRVVPTIADILPGCRLDWVTITDPAVIAASGSDCHPILRRGGPLDSVDGVYLALDAAELTSTDDYEVDDYVRVEVTLGSGATAWVYVTADDLA